MDGGRQLGREVSAFSCVSLRDCFVMTGQNVCILLLPSLTNESDFLLICKSMAARLMHDVQENRIKPEEAVKRLLENQLGVLTQHCPSRPPVPGCRRTKIKIAVLTKTFALLGARVQNRNFDGISRATQVCQWKHYLAGMTCEKRENVASSKGGFSWLVG